MRTRIASPAPPVAHSRLRSMVFVRAVVVILAVSAPPAVACTVFNGSSTISGTCAYDCIIVNGSLTVSGSVTSCGYIIVNGALDVTGTVNSGSIIINGLGTVDMDGIASIGVITVNGSLDVAGTVTAEVIDVDGIVDIDPGGVLTLLGTPGQSSNVDGLVRLQGAGATLAFMTYPVHSLYGSGQVRGLNNAGVIYIGSGVTFTNNGTIAGALTIEGPGSFANHGVVNANTTGTLKLAMGGTLSDGTNADRWKVSANGAGLEFDASIGTISTLRGNFVMTSGNSTSGIIFEKALTTFGRLQMSTGIVYVDADVAMGDDVSYYAHVTGGAVHVAAGATFLHY